METSITKQKVIKSPKNLMLEIDLQEKNRINELNFRIEEFVDTKGYMSQNTKWEAFEAIAEEFGLDRTKLISAINRMIRSKGKSVK